MDHNIALVINDHVQLLGGDTQQVADFVWQGTEVPDVRDGDHQIDVTHALAANLLFGYLNTTTVTNDSFVANALVLAAMAFIILNGAENAFAKQTTHFRFVTAVVDGFRLYNLTITAAQNILRGSQRDANLAEIASDFLCFFLELHQILIALIHERYFQAQATELV